MIEFPWPTREQYESKVHAEFDRVARVNPAIYFAVNSINRGENVELSLKYLAIQLHEHNEHLMKQVIAMENLMPTRVTIPLVEKQT